MTDLVTPLHAGDLALPERIGHKSARNAPDPATFHTPGPQDYTDYPTLAASA